MSNCESCSGTGMLTLTVPCRHCKGTGEATAFNDDGTEDLVACIHCEYGLTYIEQTCSICHGKGVTEGIMN